jgi:hypothetical protein
MRIPVCLQNGKEFFSHFFSLIFFFVNSKSFFSFVVVLSRHLKREIRKIAIKIYNLINLDVVRNNH